MLLDQENQTVNFEYVATSDLKGSLSNHLGKYVILYFYPKDDTPGCTKESIQFRDLYEEFSCLNADIFGVSKDGLKSHEKFKAKYELPFELISDESLDIATLFGSDKVSLLTKKLGVERSTFIISPDGKLVASWKPAKVPNHATAVLKKLQELINQ